MNAKVKDLIEKHIEEVDTGKFDAIVGEALCAEVLDELLDVFYDAGVSVPTCVVTEQLCQASLKGAVTSAESFTHFKNKFHYLVNKHQIVIAKTFERGAR